VLFFAEILVSLVSDSFCPIKFVVLGEELMHGRTPAIRNHKKWPILTNAKIFEKF
jgi:hypothetical protein